MSKKILYRDIKQLKNKQPAEYALIKEQKELTPLEALQDLSKLVFVYGGVEQYKLIETALKALKIIKEKNVNIQLLKAYKNNLSFYNMDMSKNKQLIQEEFDLLKEVLL